MKNLKINLYQILIAGVKHYKVFYNQIGRICYHQQL